jgi:hypothetical protein
MVLEHGRQLALVVGCQGARVLGSNMETTLEIWGILMALLGEVGLNLILLTPAGMLVVQSMGAAQGELLHNHNKL